MNQIKNYINGEFVNPIQNQWIDNYNPSNGAIYSQIPNSSSEDVEMAYQAAQEAFDSWSNSTLATRSKILARIAELIKDKLQFLAEAESRIRSTIFSPNKVGRVFTRKSIDLLREMFSLMRPS